MHTRSLDRALGLMVLGALTMASAGAARGDGTVGAGAAHGDGTIGTEAARGDGTVGTEAARLVASRAGYRDASATSAAGTGRCATGASRS